MPDGVWATEYRNANIYLEKNIPNNGEKVIRLINLESLLLQETVKNICVSDLKNTVVETLYCDISSDIQYLSYTNIAKEIFL